MAKTTFTWQPEWGSELAQKPDVNVTKFGDGYELRTPVGINNAPEKWTLKFTTSSQQYPAVLAFIRARGAVESFYWTTPLGETKLFVCRSWRMTRNKGHHSISLDFEQVFEV